jgi:hypothetical protein
VRTVWFTREYQAFTGGHQKVWDYYTHVQTSETHRSRVHFGPKNRWGGGNPWDHLQEEPNAPLAPEAGDLLFLAGKDWVVLTQEQRRRPPVPVINLIQHLRHADPDDPRSRFLEFPATRICVSEEVEQALRATGRVNGPLLTIPNALDWSGLPEAPPWSERPVDVCIAAVKRPAIGRRLAAELGPAWRVEVLQGEKLPREVFLRHLAQARIVVCLPHDEEGFFLPPLEAMAVGALVVCPDCGGNRSFCLPGVNCFRPANTPEAILAATREALSLGPTSIERLLAEAAKTVERHDLRHERARFHELLRTMVSD